MEVFEQFTLKHFWKQYEKEKKTYNANYAPAEYATNISISNIIHIRCFFSLYKPLKYCL